MPRQACNWHSEERREAGRALRVTHGLRHGPSGVHSLRVDSSLVDMRRASRNRHAECKRGYCQYMEGRCSEMLGGGYGWGPQAGYCQDWDGYCNGMMYDECCTSMHGGMMGSSTCH